MIKSATATVAPPVRPTIVPDVPVYVEIGDNGSRTLWVVVVILALSSLAFYYLAWRVPVQKRLLHTLTAIITTVAFLSYFAIATGDGIGYHKSAHVEKHKHVPNTERVVYRQVFWARYIDWSLTTPLIVVDLALLAGLSGANLVVAIVADLIFVLSGLFYAFADNKGQKWGWYAWSAIAFLVVVYQLAFNGRAAIAGKDGKTKAFYGVITSYTLIVWVIYPILWGIIGGTHRISIDNEVIVYAILDLLAKPVFGFWLLLTNDKLSTTTPALNGFWAHGFGSQGTIRVGGDDDEA
ncbi:hypothetical protein DV737_g4529, partial [Chaetothyriales sp. CBS 132003]